MHKEEKNLLSAVDKATIYSKAVANTATDVTLNIVFSGDLKLSLLSTVDA